MAAAAAVTGSPASAKSYVSKVPSDVSPEVRGLLGTVAQFKASKSHSALSAALERWDDDAVYDTPFMYLHGKDRIRAVCFVFGPLGCTLLDPKIVRIYMEAADKRAVVELDSTAFYCPTRTWWVLPSMLLPARVPHETTLTLSVKSWNDKVDRVTERLHNLPAMPFVVRWAAGTFFGTALSLLEPLALAAWGTYESAWANISNSNMLTNVTDSMAKKVT